MNIVTDLFISLLNFSFKVLILACLSISIAEAALDAYVTRQSVMQGEQLSLLVSAHP